MEATHSPFDPFGSPPLPYENDESKRNNQAIVPTSNPQNTQWAISSSLPHQTIETFNSSMPYLPSQQYQHPYNVHGGRGDFESMPVLPPGDPPMQPQYYQQQQHQQQQQLVPHPQPPSGYGGISSTEMTPFDSFMSPAEQMAPPINVADALDFILTASPPEPEPQPQPQPAPQPSPPRAPTPPPPTPSPTTSPPTSQPRPTPPSNRSPPSSSSYTPNNATRSHSAPPATITAVPESPPIVTETIEKQKEVMSRFLARNAGPEVSPLPDPALIHHSGFILTRISFRTLLFKKWKQSFWIQYGPTSLLFFRSREDYDDWKNNPYHTYKEREFLVRLKVDFLGDMMNVAGCHGYKITPVKRKGYGRREEDVLLHFKLERHMDYGPTIAACLGSQEAEEVENLRKVIIGCIKNSRQSSGGVAGVVVRTQEDPGYRRHLQDHTDYDRSYDTDNGATYDRGQRTAYYGGQSVARGRYENEY